MAECDYRRGNFEGGKLPRAGRQRNGGHKKAGGIRVQQVAGLWAESG